MKRKLFSILLGIFLLCGAVSADWIYNPFTGRLDYYEPTVAGVTTFLGLTDSPAAYTGAPLFTLRVNAAGTAVEFYNLTNVENTALSTWAGSANITTLGTIATGVWNGTAVAANKGGTGQTSYAVGDLLYASGATALSKLADVAVGQYLASGGVSTAPAWATLNQAAVAGLTTASTPTFAGVTAPLHNYGAFTAQTPSAAFTVDWSVNHMQQVTITGTTLDVTFTNPAGPCKLVLIVIQGDGDDTIDWSNEADIKCPGGVYPVLSTTSAYIDVVTFIWTGTVYLCVANYDFR